MKKISAPRVISQATIAIFFSIDDPLYDLYLKLRCLFIQQSVGSLLLLYFSLPGSTEAPRSITIETIRFCISLYPAVLFFS